MKILSALFAISLVLFQPKVVAAERFHPPVRPEDPAVIELRWQLAHGAPPVAYWMDVAWAETRRDWQNRGHWAGGLGIYTRGTDSIKHRRTIAGTWERAGGEQFAPSPDKATWIEQIVIANRIAVFGYKYSFTTNTGWKNRAITYHSKWGPVGFMGWGSIRNNQRLHLKTWLRHHPR